MTLQSVFFLQLFTGIISSIIDIYIERVQKSRFSQTVQLLKLFLQGSIS